jgi:hypothetical protein
MLSPRRCNACYEIIHPAAHICPHCRSAQAKSRWATIGSVLKWIGSITAVLSLIFAMVQLRTIVADKVNRDRAIFELLAAARFQAEAQDLEGAWNLAGQAMALNSTSPQARSLQVELALQRLRKTIHYTTSINEADLRHMIPILHRGVIAGTNRQQADVLAHLARANELLHPNIDVDLYYERALAKDPDNVYANAWYGCWLMKPNVWKSDHRQRALLAIPHLRQALSSGRESVMARTLQIDCLNGYRDLEELQPEVGIELLTIGSALKDAPEDLPEMLYEELAVGFYFLVEQWDLREAYFKRHAPGRILEVFSFLCHRAGLEKKSDTALLRKQLLIEAVLLEAAGRADEALSRLTTLLDGSFSNFDLTDARRLREQVWENKGARLSNSLFVRSMDSLGSGKAAGLREEDIILAINRRPITDFENWDAALAAIPPEARNYLATVLRGKTAITLTLPRGNLGIYFQPCRVPERLIDARRQ